MKKGLLLNSMILSEIAKMGHTDQMTIGDCGLPVRGGAERIDLALKPGVPGFLETLDAVLSELGVERVVLAREIVSVSPQMYQEIRKRFDEKVKVEFVPHEEFKKLTETSRAVVRTGECTPYSNIILVSGVPF